MNCNSHYGQAEPYHPPAWASGLKVIPNTRIPARMAEFLLADAVQNGSDCVVTYGGQYSNHLRVIAVAAREIGMDSVLFIGTETDASLSVEEIGCKGNLLFDRISGAVLVVVETQPGLTLTQNHHRIHQMMEKHAEKLRSENQRPFLIPTGGFTPIGGWGYLQAWEELRVQGTVDLVDDVVLCVGTGGTATSIAIGNYLTGSKVKIHGVSMALTADELYTSISRKLKELGMATLEPHDIIDILDDYRGGGYGVESNEVKELIVSVFMKTGIALDTTYTGKAVYGMLSMMKKTPERFQGNRVLFIHTGGVFNLFEGRLDETVLSGSSPHVQSCPQLSNGLQE